MKALLHKSVSFFLTLFFSGIFLNAQVVETPSLPSPTFSAPAGFYTSSFDLHINTSQTGIYTYSVSAVGFAPYSGEVQVVDQDVTVQVVLESTKSKPVSIPSNEKSAVSVTFRVNTTGSNVGLGDNVYISGTMVNPIWPEPGSNPDMLMARESEGSPFFVKTFDLLPGEYQYKYFRNQGWADGEWGGPPNRVVNITGNTTINDYYGHITPPPQPLFSITFVVTDGDGSTIDDAVVTFNGIEYDPGHYVFSDLVPAAVVRYTTDGSIPDENSPVFETPLIMTSREGDPNVISLIPTNNVGGGSEMWQPPAGEIFKINTIRARAFAPTMQPSPVSSASFIVDPQGPERFSMPVFSVNAHPNAFFSPDSGIYVFGNNPPGNYYQTGDEWERLTHVEFFEENGQLIFSHQLGVRTHGGTTRNRPRKTLRFYARSDYGQTWIDYQFFEDKPITRFKRFLLRNSGNDWDQAIFRDAYMQSLAKGFAKVDLQYSRPAILFLNGEYWGVHNIRDRFDNRFIETHYGLAEDEYSMLENDIVFDNGNPDGIEHYQNMYSFVEENSLANPENYAHLNTLVDIESFIDHQVVEIFLMNTDWPGNNLQYWRKMTPAYESGASEGLDGRWRWMIKDTDFGFWLNFGYVPGVNQSATHNTLAFALSPNGPSWPNPPWSTLLFRKMVQNQNFRNDLVNRFCDFLNTVFSSQNVLERLEEHRQLYLPEMEEHIHRWRTPSSLSNWHQQVDRMATFGQQRPAYMKQHLENQFGLGQTANLSVSSANQQQGGVRVNRLQPHQITNPWTGEYYKNVPLEVEAVANPGYRFSHWVGLPDGSPAKTTINLVADKAIEAHFSSALIHYWHFNNLPSGTISQVASDISLSGQGQVSYPGTGSGYMDRTDGTTLNTFDNQPAGRGLRVRNPSNSRDLIIEASSAGFREIKLSFAVHRTNNGARQQQLAYSADAGVTWMPHGESYTIPINYDVFRFDFSSIAEVNNNANLKFKISFLGEEAGGIEGNNRFDNIVVEGIPINTNVVEIEPDKISVFNYPNPFSASTTIIVQASNPTALNASIIDAQGRTVGFLHDGTIDEGIHRFEFNGLNLAPGLYFCKVVSGLGIEVLRIVKQ